MENELNALKDEIDSLEIAVENELEAIDGLNAELDALRMESASLDGSESVGVGRRAEIQKEIEETEKSTNTCREGMEKYKKRMDDYTEKADKIKAFEEENSKKIEALEAEQDELNQKITEYASDIRDIRTRIDSLRRMEELFEGYPHSVSALMNAAKAGKISGIVGPLSHIFSVKTATPGLLISANASTIFLSIRTAFSFI
jgi:chromosome segregation protein